MEDILAVLAITIAELRQQRDAARAEVMNLKKKLEEQTKAEE